MSSERRVFIPYEERVATVVGGRGSLGSKVALGCQSLGFKEVRICEEGDQFLDFVSPSTDLLFAVDNVVVADLLRSARDRLRSDHDILDGASVKFPLISLYEDLDREGKSVASFHLGAMPDMSWRGIKAWICEVGENSERAKKVAVDLFLSANSFISVINIRDHPKIEVAQFLTFSGAHTMAAAMRELGIPLAEFDLYATLNAELFGLPIGRTLGQGVKIPSEILFNQALKVKCIEALEAQVRRFKNALQDEDELRKFIQGNIDFHNDPDGFVKAMFEKAGMIGATNANIRMFHFAFRITDDESGKLRQVLEPFEREGANLSAILSRAGQITPEEREQGVDPDRIVKFYVGIDPRTVDDNKDRRIRERLIEMGCEVVDYNGF